MPAPVFCCSVHVTAGRQSCSAPSAGARAQAAQREGQRGALAQLRAPMYLNFAAWAPRVSSFITASSFRQFSTIVETHCGTLRCENGWLARQLFTTCARRAAARRLCAPSAWGRCGQGAPC